MAPYNVLFLCTGNSARSIMAEALLNRLGFPNFTAYSAGSHATGRVNPCAVRQLEQARLPVSGLRSKSWDEFAQPGAPRFDFVFTVCDNAAREVCPVWLACQPAEAISDAGKHWGRPGQRVTAHWGVPDPAGVSGSPEQIARAFQDAFVTLERRIRLFVALPLESLDELALQSELTRIGKA